MMTTSTPVLFSHCAGRGIKGWTSWRSFCVRDWRHSLMFLVVPWKYGLSPTTQLTLNMEFGIDTSISSKRYLNYKQGTCLKMLIGVNAMAGWWTAIGDRKENAYTGKELPHGCCQKAAGGLMLTDGHRQGQYVSCKPYKLMCYFFRSYVCFF